MMTAQPGGDPAAPSLGWGLDGSQGGAVSHQGSGGSPHGHGFTSEGSSELVRFATMTSKGCFKSTPDLSSPAQQVA